MNRLKKLLQIKECGEESLARILGVPVEIVFDWEDGKYDIDQKHAKTICERFNAPLKYLLGYYFKITLPVSKWRKDLQDDYRNADPALREYMECLYGKPEYYKEKPADEGGLEDVTIEYGRKRIRLKLTRDEIDSFESYIARMNQD